MDAVSGAADIDVNVAVVEAVDENVNILHFEEGVLAGLREIAGHYNAVL